MEVKVSPARSGVELDDHGDHHGDTAENVHQDCTAQLEAEPVLLLPEDRREDWDVQIR